MRGLKRLRRSQRTVLLNPDAELVSKSRPDDRMMRSQVLTTLDQHLDRLAPKPRAAFVLRVVLGHSVPEVAEITGARINTVRDRLRVADRERRRHE